MLTSIYRCMKKNDFIFLIVQEKTIVMRKYEVIFYVRTQHVIFLKKVYQCFREFLIKTIHWFTSIWKKNDFIKSNHAQVSTNLKCPIA